MQEDLPTCDECGSGLPAPVDGCSQCPQCGTEHLARTGEVAAITERTLPTDRGSSHDGEDAARISMTERGVLELVRRHFGVLGTVFLSPDIPEKKEQAARKAHVVHLPAAERVLALYDGSRTGSGEEGFVLTTRRLCWKNNGGKACSILWRDIDPDRLYLDGLRLFVDDEAIALDDEDVLESCADAFHVLALSARPQVSGHMPAMQDTSDDGTPSAWFLRAADPASRRPSSTTRAGTPAPPHSASYLGYAVKAAERSGPSCKCWHCHTPLHQTTPQCGYCGAIPKKAGWLRTG